jgi:hypothetical protein
MKVSLEAPQVLTYLKRRLVSGAGSAFAVVVPIEWIDSVEERLSLGRTADFSRTFYDES